MFELDDTIINNKNDRKSLQVIYNKKPIYVCHYQNGQKALVSYGRIKEFNQSSLYHLCDTQKGSSGAPILSLDKNRLIGIHIGGKINKINEGVLILDCINEFINIFNQKKNIINIAPNVQTLGNQNNKNLKLKFEQLEEITEPSRKKNQNFLNEEMVLKRNKSFIQKESFLKNKKFKKINNYQQIQNKNNNFNYNNKNNINLINKGNIIFNNILRSRTPIQQNNKYNYNNGINNNIPILNVIPNNYINNNKVPYNNIHNYNNINNNRIKVNYLNYNNNIVKNINSFRNYNNNLNINNNLYNQNYLNQNKVNIVYTLPI